jgi:hypothetical protein
MELEAAQKAESSWCVEDTRRPVKLQTAEDLQRLSLAISPRLPGSDGIANQRQ